MTEKQILDVVYRQINKAIEQKLTDKAPKHFEELKQFIEEERKKSVERGGWL
jgi:hypothetical protein